MSIVRDKYRVLAPRVSLLSDVVVLAQAWKKAHTYIRRHNWYADTLELDCSAVDLDRRLLQWSEELKDGGFQPNPAWLVPAPKNCAWGFGEGFFGGWGSVLGGEEGRPFLRPLAHLGIREQTVSTAAILCLADCIETAQGNTSLPAEGALAAGVFSYGNRLYCRWSDDNTRAHFSWGNATSYSRYFQDYQQFVERPNVLARKAEGENPDAAVFIVKLDLSAFYDNVDIESLVRKLKTTYSAYKRRYAEVPAADPQFWTRLRKIMTFAWREEDCELKGLFRGKVLPRGLPQGLLASGFFANAYMLAFDEELGAVAQAGGSVGEHELVTVHDYCRYVDDLRLVVSVSDWPNPEALIRDVIPHWVQEQLDATTGAGRLRINQDKTEVEPYRAVGGDAGTAARMKLLQHQLSGPFDVATLQQVEAGLNGLLALAELGAATASSGTDLSSIPLLASVARPKLEVRDDTLTRFSAYRLTRSLRMRRSMTSLTEELPEGGTVKEALLHDFEVTARRLVAAWSVNPSLVQVLRYALDLFPSPNLLKPVLDALKTKLREKDAPEDERRVAYYVLAELFKAGATETGRQASRDVAFVVGDLEAYRNELVALATEALQTWPLVPWYVQQQASLLLASSRTPLAALPTTPELAYHRALNDYVKGKSRCRELPSRDEVAVSLVGMQLNSNEKHYFGWFRDFSKGRPNKDVSEAVRLIGHTNHDLLAAVVGRSKKFSPPEYLRVYLDCRWRSPALQLETNVWIPFLKVISHPRAIFSEENALLHLVRCLTTDLPKGVLKQPHGLTPASLSLRCADWNKLKDPTAKVLEVSWRSDIEIDPTYGTPTWCGKGRGWMYAFGRLLRAAATGQPDFTARNWLLTEDGAGWYRGIRSTWQSRRTGMVHTSTALVGTTSAITPWMSALLLELLRWPGIANGNGGSLLAGIDSVEEFSELIAERLREQSEIYGHGSDMPVYRYPVQWPLRESRCLRVVQVQGLMPASSDFVDGLEGLDALGYRERHRNHTAALLHLAYRHIKVRDEVLGRQEKPEVDLVIFPEFAIHVDDQDLMRAFSDATGAMLFYGLVGATAPGVSGPVNAARWLVPQRRGGRRSWVEVDQGKWHLTADEENILGISPWRPYQVVIELQNGNERPYRISGAICYDATDLALAADLRDETHMFVVAAMNKDVKTFDSMVSALRYHMYQHVLVVNCGEYGGSTAQAPYDAEHKRLISHVHGGNQLSVSVFDIELDDFGPALRAAAPPVPVMKVVRERVGKTRPAGLNRR